MKAIITGASGFIGKQLINSLIDKNYKIIALDIKFDDVLLNNPKVKCINVLNVNVEDLVSIIPLDKYDCSSSWRRRG